MMMTMQAYPVAPQRISKWEPHRKIFVVSLKSTISRFGKRFRDGQYSLGTFLFFCSCTLGAPVSSHL